MSTLDNKYSDIALLLMRLGIGYIFIVHGWDKLTGIEGTSEFFGSLGIPQPFIMAWVVAVIEFFGGLWVVVGAYTKTVSFFLAVIMVVSIFVHSGNFELELLLLTVTLSLFMVGSGHFSVDHKMANR